MNAGLTQVLNDGTHSYVYGLDLVSQQTGINEEYPQRVALGSVRQMTAQKSAFVSFTRSGWARPAPTEEV